MNFFYWNKAYLKSNGSHFCFNMLILVHCICCLIQKQASWLMAVSMSMSACSVSLMLIPLQLPSKRRSSHVIETINHKGKTLLSQHTFPIILWAQENGSSITSKIKGSRGCFKQQKSTKSNVRGWKGTVLLQLLSTLAIRWLICLILHQQSSFSYPNQLSEFQTTTSRNL